MNFVESQAQMHVFTLWEKPTNFEENTDKTERT